MKEGKKIVRKKELRNIIREKLQTTFSDKKPSIHTKKLMTAKKTRQFPQIDQSTLNKWKKEDKIPYTKKGKRVYYDKEEVFNSHDSFATEKYNKLK